MRIATFNLQNLRLRGDRLDGARDRDLPADQGRAARGLDAADRRLTAEVIQSCNADLIALQEVFDQTSLDYFHAQDLVPLGLSYPYRHCLPGNDGRGFDVAVMSRLRPSAVISHAALTPRDLGQQLPLMPESRPIFRRDALQVEIGGLTLFICHFKAPYPKTDQVRAIRRAEAKAVRALIEHRFAQPSEALWMVLGDLNDPGFGDGLQPLRGGFAIDLLDRLPESDRWSWFNPMSKSYSHPDAMLVSPALARRWPKAVPDIIRSGMGLEAERNAGPHLAQVGQHRPHASDHAAVVVELTGL